VKNETNALKSVLFFITRRFPASFSQVPMNLSISDIIFHRFRKRCSHHSISSSPLLPASEHPTWPVLLVFFQSQHTCTSGSSDKPMRAFHGTAPPFISPSVSSSPHRGQTLDCFGEVTSVPLGCGLFVSMSARSNSDFHNLTSNYKGRPRLCNLWCHPAPFHKNVSSFSRLKETGKLRSQCLLF